MTQKEIEACLGVIERDVGDINKEVMRIPVLDQTLEKLATEMRENHRAVFELFHGRGEGNRREPHLGLLKSHLEKENYGKERNTKRMMKVSKKEKLPKQSKRMEDILD